MNRKEFLKKIDRITDLPTLPQVAMQVNRLLDSQSVTVKEVGETIEKDQAIVPKLLRLVNSSFFGLEQKVSSVSRAVVILGFNTVRNAVVSVSVIESLRSIGSDRIDFTEFWRHAISCAVISRYLAARCGSAAPEDAFTAGLIHDMGKLVLAKFFPKEFGQIMEAVGMGKSFFESEADIIPLHHNQIGAHLTKRWRLSPVVIDAVLYSHGTRNDSAHPVACIVSCADRILQMKDQDPGTMPMEWRGCEIVDKLRWHIHRLQEWLPEMEVEIESACRILMGEAGNGK